MLQKHVARAVWHLAAANETRQLLLGRGPVLALQRLAQGSRSLQGRDLAQQALRRIHDDPLLRNRLPPEVVAPVSATSNLSANNLPELTMPAGRVSDKRLILDLQRMISKSRYPAFESGLPITVRREGLSFLERSRQLGLM